MLFQSRALATVRDCMLELLLRPKTSNSSAQLRYSLANHSEAGYRKAASTSISATSSARRCEFFVNTTSGYRTVFQVRNVLHRTDIVVLILIHQWLNFLSPSKKR